MLEVLRRGTDGFRCPEARMKDHGDQLGDRRVPARGDRGTVSGPAVREAVDNGDELADEAIAQEHEEILLHRLHDGTPGEPDHHDALQEFVKLGREHIRYEQEVVWPVFEAAVSREDREKIGDKLEAGKKSRRRVRIPILRRMPRYRRPWSGAAIVDHVRDVISGREADNPPDPQTK